METMQPTLKNGRNVWDRINMPPEEYQRRIEAIRKIMAHQGIDVLLAYGHAFNNYGNYCYLSGYMIRLPRGALVALTRDDVTLFFEGASRGLPSARQMTWLEDIRPCADIAAECVKYLNENALTSSTIGLAGLEEWMPWGQWKRLHESLAGCNFVNSHTLLEEMRMIKSQREQDQVRRASRIVTMVFEKLEAPFRMRLDERSLEAVIIREARLEGAEDVRVLLARPAHQGWAFHPAGEDPFQPGETLLIHLALSYERYWAEAARTFRVTEGVLAVPSLKQLELLYHDLAGCLQPGKMLSECYNGMLEMIREQDSIFILAYGLGQGIGLSPAEQPWLRQDEPGRLETGMCLSLRVCVFDEDLGGVTIGNSLVVTDKGVDMVTA